MGRPVSMAFAVNGQTPEGFKLPEVNPATLLGAPMFPDPSYFQRPADLVPGQKVIPRLNQASPLFGQVFGYVAPKNQCILDLDPNSCWIVPPSPTSYTYATQGRTILNDTTEIATANMGGAGGHAPRDAGLADVQRYYEDVSTQLARVVYGEDDYGVWAAGSLVPTATWGDALSVLASATSGDWRWVDELSAFDFLGSCLVNIPGFPMFSRAAATTRLVRAASATPLGDKVMIVTMNGSIAQEEEPMSDKACACQSHDEEIALDAVTAAAFSTKQRQQLAKDGIAMPDGSFPIRNKTDLMNAIHAIGRAKDPAAAKAHIIKRAKALGLTNMLPADWSGSTKSKSASADTEETEMTEDEFNERLSTALAERDEAWQTKLDAAVEAATTPLNDRLSTVEAISLGVLDSVSA